MALLKNAFVCSQHHDDDIAGAMKGFDDFFGQDQTLCILDMKDEQTAVHGENDRSVYGKISKRSALLKKKTCPKSTSNQTMIDKNRIKSLEFVSTGNERGYNSFPYPNDPCTHLFTGNNIENRRYCGDYHQKELGSRNEKVAFANSVESDLDNDVNIEKNNQSIIFQKEQQSCISALNSTKTDNNFQMEDIDIYQDGSINDPCKHNCSKPLKPFSRKKKCPRIARLELSPDLKIIDPNIDGKRHNMLFNKNQKTETKDPESSHVPPKVKKKKDLSKNFPFFYISLDSIVNKDEKHKITIYEILRKISGTYLTQNELIYIRKNFFKSILPKLRRDEQRNKLKNIEIFEKNRYLVLQMLGKAYVQFEIQKYIFEKRPNFQKLEILMNLKKYANTLEIKGESLYMAEKGNSSQSVQANDERFKEIQDTCLSYFHNDEYFNDTDIDFESDDSF